MKDIEFRLSSFALVVHDLDAALGFYRDVLGFLVRDEVESGGMRLVSVTPPAQPDIRITLRLLAADPYVSPVDRRAIEDLTSKGLLGSLVFTVDDCDAVFAHIEAAGAEVLQEPINQTDGFRDCAFLDSSGNILRFTQPAANVATEPLAGAC